MDPIEARIIQIIDAHRDELEAIAEDIYTHAEQGYHEYRTARLTADYLKKLGLKPQEGLAITGVRTDIGKGNGPCIALIGELDGLACPTHPAATPEGFAHACGHYAQITCMLGAALALSDPQVAESLDGLAAIYAVPAEEYLDASVREEVRASHGVLCSGGKCELLRRGLMDDIDMAVTTHALMAGRDSGADLMLGCSACTGFIGKTIYMHGRASHAAAAPHLGANALNAAALGISALGLIRETFEEKDCVRVHPYIRKGGEAINIVPSEVVVDMMVRAKTQEAIEKVSKKVDNCFKGAAMAIGCEAEIVDSQGYMPCPERMPEPILTETAALLGNDIKTVSIPAGICNTASTDVGDLSHVLPVVNFTHAGAAGALHSADFRLADEEKAVLAPAKMLALTVYHLLRSGAALAREVTEGFSPVYSAAQYVRHIEEGVR